MISRTQSWKESRLASMAMATLCLAGVGLLVAVAYLFVALMFAYPLFRALMLPAIFWLAIYSAFRRR